MTCRRSSGGKAPRSAGARCILEAGQTVGHIAFSPLTHGVAVAVESVGDLLISRLVGFGGAEHNPTAVNHGLGCRTGANKSVECIALFDGEHHTRCERT